MMPHRVNLLLGKRSVAIDMEDTITEIHVGRTHRSELAAVRDKMQLLRSFCPQLLYEPARCLAGPVLDDGLLVDKVIGRPPTVRARPWG